MYLACTYYSPLLSSFLRVGISRYVAVENLLDAELALVTGLVVGGDESQP